MRPQLKIALVIAFVAFDMLLVVLAVHHVRQPAPKDGSGIVAPPRDPTTTSISPTTPTTSSTSTTSTTSSAVPPAVERPETMLSIGIDGVLLRATTGDCQVGPDASVEVSTDGGQTFNKVLSHVPQVVRVVAVSRSDLWIVETNKACQPAVQRSGDTGASWVRSQGSKGAWHLSPSVDDSRIHAPSGAREVGCQGVSLAALDSTLAYVGCNDGDVRMSSDGGDSWSTVGRVDGLVSLTFEDASRGFALAHDEKCAGRVLITDNSGRTWRRRNCLEGVVPEAIATNGNRVVAQVDDQLWISDDGGQTWARPS